MKILVTGGTGFIGSFMARYLAQKGNDVTICDNNFRGSIDKSISHLKFISCDLTKKQELDKLESDYDCVYHFAAINGTENFYNIPHKVLKVNTLININIIDWCVENKINRVLSTSSSETYACTKDKKIPTPEDVILSIDDIYNPRYSYAGSKIFGELLFLSYKEHYGLDIRIVRPHNIYGPRMGFEHVIPQVAKRIFNKEDPFKIYGYNQSRSFCYIEDAVNGLELIMNNEECSGKVFNLGSDDEIKIKDLVDSCFEISNYYPKTQLVDPPLGSVERRLPDINLISNLTGYKPSVSLRGGLDITLNWYLSHYDK